MYVAALAVALSAAALAQAPFPRLLAILRIEPLARETTTSAAR